MIVIVCGGRNYSNTLRIDTALEAAQPYMVIHGGAAGADSIAGRWAQDFGVPALSVPARWSTEGKAAGPKRNARTLALAMQIAKETNLGLIVFAFPGGTGTANMIEQALGLGLTVRQFA